MTGNTDVSEPQEKLYTLKDEIARRPARKASTKSKPVKGRRQSRLAGIETSLHPLCECCGERIEIARLSADVNESLCQACESREGRN